MMRPRRRLGWLEACCRYMKILPKKGLRDYFEISEAQMSSDLHHLAHVMRKHGSDARVSKGKIEGQLPDRHVFDTPSLAEIVRSGAFGKFLSLDAQLRVETSDEILGNVLTAVLNKKVIRIDYVSMTSGPTTRIISPHRLVEVAGRMHTRAYDHDKNAYRDFVLNRVSRIYLEDLDISYVDASRDVEFNTVVRLRLMVNPALSQDKRGIVCQEFDLGEKGHREIVVAKAHEIYLRAQVGQTKDDHVPPVIFRSVAD
jgi:hypothetical protein